MLRAAVRFLFIVYWVCLSVLLLVPDPAKLVRLSRVPIFPWGKFGIHLMFFLALGFLANAARWPKWVSWRLLAVLAAYGIATEWLQRFVPHRTSRVIDAFENLLGIAVGSAIYWLVLRSRPVQSAAERNADCE